MNLWNGPSPSRCYNIFGELFCIYFHPNQYLSCIRSPTTTNGNLQGKWELVVGTHTTLQLPEDIHPSPPISQIAKHSCNQATYPPGAEKTCAHKPWQLRSKNFCTSQKQRGERWTGAQLLSNDQQGVLTACQVNFWRQDGHYSWDTNFCESMLRVHKMFPDSDSEFRCWHTKFCHMKADIFRKIAVKTDIDIDTLKKLFLGRFIWCFFWVEPTINEVLGRYNIERMIFHKTHAGSTSISTVNIVYMGWLGQQQKWTDVPWFSNQLTIPTSVPFYEPAWKEEKLHQATKKSLFLSCSPFEIIHDPKLYSTIAITSSVFKLFTP